jgi:hypothetical protein
VARAEVELWRARSRPRRSWRQPGSCAVKRCRHLPRAGFRLAQVVPLHLVSGAHQARRHVLPHHAQADETDFHAPRSTRTCLATCAAPMPFCQPA